jgi:hypothetical protein
MAIESKQGRLWRAAVASLVMVGATAFAQDKPAASPDERLAARFAKADTNGDGALSIEEAKAGMPRVAEHFGAIDADGNGSVTVEEIKQARAAMQQ